MNNLFRYDGPLIRILTRIGNMMIVSFLWVAFCIPVLTIVPASAALYHTTAKVIRGTGNGVMKDFWSTFRGNLLEGLILNALMLVSGFLLYLCLRFGYDRVDTTLGIVYFGAGCVVAVIWSAVAIHVPPALSRFEGGVGTQLRISLYLALSQLFRSAGAVLLLAAVIYLTAFYPLVLILMPGLYTDLICSGMERRMGDLIRKNGLDPDEAAEETEESGGEPAEDSPLQQAAMLEESGETGGTPDKED